MKKRNSVHKRFFSQAEGTKPYYWNLFHILMFGVFLSSCSVESEVLTPETPASAEFTFDQYEIVTGITKRQSVLTGFLLDGPIAELAVVHINENNDHRLRVYAFSGDTWTPKHDVSLRPEVLFVDVANIDGRDRLIMYERGYISWLDPESATESLLVAVASNFQPPRRDEIPHVDITRDLNGDNRDDLVVPDVDGFWVCIQMSDGTFAEKVKIGSSTEMERILGADGYRYDPWSQSRIHEIDFNRDGRKDLVFWNEDHFKVHLQDERGLFSSKVTTFMVNVGFDSDQLSPLATGDMIGSVLYSLADLNGDSVADLLVFKLSGKNISNKHSSYEVHFGAPTSDGGTLFARDPDIAFESDEKIQIAMDQHDFNRDGQIDLMITTINIEFLKGSLWKRIKGFMGDDIGLGLEFYQMEKGAYSGTPNTTRGIALDGVPSHREPGWVPLDVVLRGATHENRNGEKSYPRAFNTTLLVGDVTGDGRSDLIIGDHPRIMVVFVGVPGPEMFAQQPQVVRIAMPNDEEYTWLVDLNKDGMQDILMHHPFTLRDGHGAPIHPPGTESHRITILIAR
ncbi:MAG: FG-GAP and VCBS repeat-containing protein [Candidatus Poribacteria bacterium]|nr:FG-GAP and VCBS repeat-containing protein [Candidatus Poribacteria bacterium]